MGVDESPDSLKIYKDLRLNIIHGQICLGKFFEWKRNMREKQILVAQENFKKALMDDSLNEARKQAL